MWTRGALKSRAKDVLKTSYWQGFVVSLILAVVGGGGTGVSFNFNRRGFGFGTGLKSEFNFGEFENFFKNGFQRIPDFKFDYDFDFKFLPVIIAIVIAAILFAIIIAALFKIFLGFPLETGGAQYFKQSAQLDTNFNHLGFAFKKERYFNIIKALLWRAVLIFLWSLLFVIPGIVKFYSYRMVPYIMSDNPNLLPDHAIALSRKMTAGQKFNIFVLDLSFIGWYILGAMALFIGVLFVNPYFNAVHAELYLALRQNALDSGAISIEELLPDSGI